LDEHLTIFNIYKQFHKKPEEKTKIVDQISEQETSDKKSQNLHLVSDAQISELALLIGIS